MYSGNANSISNGWSRADGATCVTQAQPAIHAGQRSAGRSPAEELVNAATTAVAVAEANQTRSTQMNLTDGFEQSDGEELARSNGRRRGLHGSRDAPGHNGLVRRNLSALERFDHFRAGRLLPDCVK